MDIADRCRFTAAAENAQATMLSAPIAASDNHQPETPTRVIYALRLQLMALASYVPRQPASRASTNERLYSPYVSSPKKPVTMISRFKNVAVVSAVQNCANALRETIFQLPDNEFLGSEDSLTRELGVSTPTLRQAARVLEHEQLLTIKRGVAGGYYTRRPDPQAVGHMAAIFLRARKAGISEALEVSKPLAELAVRLACRNSDKKLRAELTDLLASEGEPHGRRQADLDATFSNLLARMTANSVLLLLLSIFNDYGALVATTRERVLPMMPPEFHANRAQIAAAILDGNEASAVALVNRRLEIAHNALKRLDTPGRRKSSRAPDRARA
jgi:GntR family transcriptional repressor for pyruvate dehydrogenase complex